MHFLIFLVLLLPFLGNSHLHGVEERVDLIPKIHASINTGSAPPPPGTHFRDISTFNPSIPKVNVVTGEYCEEETDFTIAGIDPATILWTERT